MVSSRGPPPHSALRKLSSLTLADNRVFPRTLTARPGPGSVKCPLRGPEVTLLQQRWSSRWSAAAEMDEFFPYPGSASG